MGADAYTQAVERAMRRLASAPHGQKLKRTQALLRARHDALRHELEG